jgi:carboxylesterase type B
MRYRPICPQPFLPFPDYWDADIPADVPSFPDARSSEFECLNLSITTPHASATTSTKKVPVLVFIHGGAFVGGSQTVRVGGREIYDGYEAVRASIALDLPIVVVTLNYRVGPLGFLASEQLATFNKAHDEPVGNYGLHDQRQALLWISKFIGGFGGDADNVTIYGTSAGAASCHYQSIFPDRKFKRAILSSATLFGIGAMPLDYCQQTFEKFEELLVKDKGKEDGDVVKVLQDVEVEEFVHAVSISLCTPLMDGTWVKQEALLGDPDDANPPDLMIGSCAYEVSKSLHFSLDSLPPSTYH